MITLDDVTLTFPDGAGRVTAVDHVSLTGRPGMVTGVTGPSGRGSRASSPSPRPSSGPTRGRCGWATPTRRDSRATRRPRSAASRLGIVFQQPNLLPSLTAREQLQVMAELGGRDRRARRRSVRARTDELLDAVGLADHADKRPAQLSGGQRQRVAIARALVGEPQVLLVDEPTSALDQERGAAIMDLISQLTRQRGTATLLVTHDLVHREALDELVTVVDGRVVDRDAAAGRRASVGA